MTHADSGTATSIAAPANEGTYYIYVIDQAGNISSASTATLTVDNTAPTNQNDVFPSAAYETVGGTVTIVSSGTASNQVWIAPAGTSSFSAGATMTQAASGTSTSMTAPTTAGTYYIYVIDQAGNVSSASTAALTVGNAGFTKSKTAVTVTEAGAGNTATFTVVLASRPDSDVVILYSTGHAGPTTEDARS